MSAHIKMELCHKRENTQHSRMW